MNAIRKQQIEEASKRLQARRQAAVASKKVVKKSVKKTDKVTIPAKPRRDWLKRQIIKGNMLCKCTQSLTDDYQYDLVNDFGKSEWMECKVNGEFVEGVMNFNDYDFRTKSGGLYLKDGILNFYTHSNDHYELKLKADR